MEVALLVDRPKALPTVAGWYFEQWRRNLSGETVATTAAWLRLSANRSRLPLMLIAFEKGRPVGAGQLKLREMDIYQDREYWLGGVVVDLKHRGKKIGSHLVCRLVDIAKALRVKVLYLQTERLDGGLYARLGWQPRELVDYKGAQVRVMEMPILV